MVETACKEAAFSYAYSELDRWCARRLSECSRRSSSYPGWAQCAACCSTLKIHESLRLPQGSLVLDIHGKSVELDGDAWISSTAIERSISVHGPHRRRAADCLIPNPHPTYRIPQADRPIMAAYEILQQLYALETSSPDFLRVLYAWIRSEGPCTLTTTKWRVSHDCGQGGRLRTPHPPSTPNAIKREQYHNIKRKQSKRVTN